MRFTRSPLFMVLIIATWLACSVGASAASLSTEARAKVPQKAPSAPRTPAIAGTNADLALDARRLVEATALKKAKLAVSIRDASGRVIVDIAGSEPMLPASNMKLVTTGVALATLGSDFSFRTRLLADGDRLTVVGDGDPSFGDPELLSNLVCVDPDGREQTGLTIEALLKRWTDAVVASGRTRISELVVDDRIFDRSFVHPIWPKDQLNERYCAEICGLNFHLNRLHLYPRPVAGAKPDLSRIEPSVPFLSIRNRATSKSGKSDSAR